MTVQVMTPIYRGKRTVDLDFVDFCQFQNVFKGEGRFFKVFPELWDFALTTSDHLYHSAGREGVRQQETFVHNVCQLHFRLSE